MMMKLLKRNEIYSSFEGEREREVGSRMWKRRNLICEEGF